MVKEKKPSVAKLKKIADKYYSQYVRLRDADTRGMLVCISCDVIKPWKEMQAGHFVSRRVSSLRFFDENVNGQCISCNMFKQGNQYAYALALDLKYGEGTAAKLHAQRMNTHKFTITELEEIIHDAKVQIDFYESQTTLRP